jgi:tetratricopeptide (TPR) repeat protein
MVDSWARAVIVALVGALVAFETAVPASAGITVEVAADQAEGTAREQIELYGASHALVIGNDAYTAGWPALRNAVADAREVAKTLEGQGFDVTMLTDLNAEGMRKALKEFLVLTGADPEARLLVWYAGHGHSADGEGFLVPVDAPAPGDPSFALYALPMRDVGTMVRLAKLKHVLAIFDSCFAGTIFEARAGAPPPAITRATLLPVRQFVASGDADQTVADNGSFRTLFLRAISGEEGADANGDGYVTGSELGSFLADRVTNLTGGAQTPRYGKLLDVNFDRGDFVFVLPGGATAAPAAAVPEPTQPAVEPAEAEVALLGEPSYAEERAWQETGDDSAELGAFLAQFPAGAYRNMAGQKFGAPPEPAAAEPDPPAHACDKYAAHPDDPGRAGRGVAWGGMPTAKALAACREAVAAFPDAPRFAYQLGRALVKDGLHEEAIESLQGAANAGYVPAIDLLAWMHQTGRGFENDNEGAFELYERAAKQGYAPSQYALATALETGLGVEQDPLEALVWYRAAAGQGFASAQVRMADVLNAGLLGETNPLEALVWYDIALRRLPADERAGATERRQALVDSLLPEDVALAAQLAQAWRPATPIVPAIE